MGFRTPWSSAALWLIALVAYVATGIVGRRSPHYGGGTKVLSWIGFIVPCIAWIAMIQGYIAINRSSREADAATKTASLKDRSQFIAWSVVYVIALLAGGVLYRV